MSYKREEEMWREWVDSGKHPSKLRPLLQSLEPLVQQSLNKYRGADVAPPALRTQAENQLIQGLNTYSPAKGALSTHLNWQMRGLGRFVEKHQNFARIPGSRIHSVGKYHQAVSELSDELGRTPSLAEIAKRSRIPSKQVKRLQKELAPVHLTGLMVDEFGAPLDFAGMTVSADKERLEMAYPSMTPVEKSVVDYSLGRNGKRKITSTQELARELKVSPARISNVRASIAAKTKKLGWIR